MTKKFIEFKSSVFIGILVLFIFVLSNPKTLSAPSVEDKIIMDITPRQTIQQTTPGQLVTFDIELKNLGGQKAIIYCEILDDPEGWRASIVPDLVIDEYSTTSITFTVSPPSGIGYHDESETIRVSFTPTHYLNTSLELNETILTFQVRSEGFYLAGLEIVAIIVALLVILLAILIVKKRMKKIK